MKFETELRQAQGLGSAKSGLRHWITQRITAVILIPLSIWFVGLFIILLSAPFDIAYHQFSSPWSVTLSIFFIIVLFFHGALGMQVVYEDYVRHELTKWILVVVTNFFSILMALLSIISILKIFLS